MRQRESFLDLPGDTDRGGVAFRITRRKGGISVSDTPESEAKSAIVTDSTSIRGQYGRT